MCRAVENEFMVSRGDSFIDGTRCEQNDSKDHWAFNLCVMGSCRVSAWGIQVNLWHVICTKGDSLLGEWEKTVPQTTKSFVLSLLDGVQQIIEELGLEIYCSVYASNANDLQIRHSSNYAVTT